MNSNSVSRNPFVLLDKKKMTESLAALKARYNARPKCQEHSWDIRSFTRLQMQAFLDILHRDCDETECEADNSSNDWRSHPEAYGLKYKAGLSAPTATAPTVDASTALTLVQLTKAMQDMKLLYEKQQDTIALMTRKDKKKHRSRDCIEDVDSSDDDLDIQPGDADDFYDFWEKRNLRLVTKDRESSHSKLLKKVEDLNITKWTTAVCKSSLDYIWRTYHSRAIDKRLDPFDLVQFVNQAFSPELYGTIRKVVHQTMGPYSRIETELSKTGISDAQKKRLMAARLSESVVEMELYPKICRVIQPMDSVLSTPKWE